MKFESDDSKLKFRRSLIPVNITAKSTYQHGFLYPVGDPIETLASDTWDLDLNFMTIMSTPIYPIMSNIYQYYAVFNVPRRVIFAHEKQFDGEASDYGIATEISLPTVYANEVVVNDTLEAAFGNNGADFGSAFGFYINQEDPTEELKDEICTLPIRAFMSVYNEFFRNPNFCPKYLFDVNEYGHVSHLASLSGSYISGINPLPKVQKFSDVFVDCLPWQQKSDPIELSVGEDVEVITKKTEHTTTGLHGLIMRDASGNLPSALGDLHIGTSGYVHQGTESSGSSTSAVWSPTNLYANTDDLAVNIKALKNALLVDDLYTSLLKAPRYKDYLRVLFGEEVSDDLVDVPQFLGMFKGQINIDRVYQTTGYASGDTSELGQVGASSVTARQNQKLVPRVTTKENGYLVIVTYFKHERSYSQGIAPIYLKKDFLDFYQSPLANAPDVPVSLAHIYWDGNNSSDIFGFNEYGWDYKKFMSTTRGMIDPRRTGSLDFMTLTDKFENEPVLGQQFVEEDRTALARCLTTGIDGIDYVNDTWIHGSVARIVPLYNKSNGGGL